MLRNYKYFFLQIIHFFDVVIKCRFFLRTFVFVLKTYFLKISFEIVSFKAQLFFNDI